MTPALWKELWLREASSHLCIEERAEAKATAKAVEKALTENLLEALRNGKHQANTSDGRRICFKHNISSCPDAEDGKECKKGLHLCSRKGCKKSHSAKDCDKAD